MTPSLFGLLDTVAVRLMGLLPSTVTLVGVTATEMLRGGGGLEPTPLPAALQPMSVSAPRKRQTEEKGRIIECANSLLGADKRYMA